MRLRPIDDERRQFLQLAPERLVDRRRTERAFERTRRIQRHAVEADVMRWTHQDGRIVRAARRSRLVRMRRNRPREHDAGVRCDDGVDAAARHGLDGLEIGVHFAGQRARSAGIPRPGHRRGSVPCYHSCAVFFSDFLWSTCRRI